MSRQRIVLIAGGDRNDPVEQVLREYEQVSMAQVQKDAMTDFVPNYPGRVALEWLDEGWHLAGPTWRRYWWHKPGGFPDSQQRDQEAHERIRAEAEARHLAKQRRKQETAQRRRELAALREKEKGKK
jgi:hypothetical protein